MGSRLTGGSKTRAISVAVAVGVVTIAATAGTGASGKQPVDRFASALASAKAPVGQFHRTRTVRVGSTKIVRYQQQVGNVLVRGAEVAIIDGPSIAPDVVSDTTSRSVAAPAEPKISSAKAISIARAATGARGNRVAPASTLLIDPGHDDALVRDVTLASKRPLKTFEVIVDARSGRVLSKRNVLRYATGQAKLFVPNPVVSNNGYAGIGSNKTADRNDRDTALLKSLRVPVTLERLNAGKCLSGKYVVARLGEKKGRPVCRKVRNWNSVTRSDDRFEALMTYFSIDSLQSYLHSIGFSGSANVHPGPIVAIADYGDVDNSFYDPADRKVRFGSGGVDDAEDADVIVHEFGHAIQDAQDRGFGSSGSQAGGLGEGFGDFISALYTSTVPGVADYETAENCIFEWDGTAGYGGPGVRPCGRLANGVTDQGPTSTFQQAKQACAVQGSFEPHCLGTLWSHGLIDLLNDIPAEAGAPPIVRDLLTSQFTYADNETFSQAVNALVAADTSLYGGTHVVAICNEMVSERGIPASSCP